MKPARVEVLLNASAGAIEREGKEKLRGTLEAAFTKHSISVRIKFLEGTDLRAGAQRALQRASRGELDAVVASGGDGSIRTVAGVLADSGVPLGVIPLGTLNHFAKDLRIPISVEDAVTVIAAGETRTVDVGEVNGRIFINNSSIGIYPYLVLDRERQQRQQGLSKWPAMVAAGLRAVRNFPLRRLTVRAHGRDESFRSPCVFVGNNVYGLTGLSMGSRERLDEGKLCLFVTRQQSAMALLGLVLRSVLGLLDQERDLRTLELSELEVSSRHRDLLVALDGEVETIQSPLNYRTRPGALRVFAPSATGS